jgi:hypothetical protein
MGLKLDVTDDSRRAAALGYAGETLGGQFAELAARPCSDKCELLLRSLADAERFVALVRDALVRGEAATE